MFFRFITISKHTPLPFVYIEQQIGQRGEVRK